MKPIRIAFLIFAFWLPPAAVEWARGADDPTTAPTKPSEVIAREIVLPQTPDAAPLITLHTEQIPIANLLQQLGEQSKMPLVWGISNNSGPLASCDADAWPFWAVILDLCRQAHLQAIYNTVGKLQINPMGTNSPLNWPGKSALVVGRFLLIPKNIEHVHDFTVSANRQDFCQLNLDLMPDPDMRILYYQAYINPSAAQDENGKSLLPPIPTTQPVPDPRISRLYGAENEFGDLLTVGQYGPPAMATHVRLTPQAGSRKIAILRGTISVWVARRIERIEIPNVLEKVTFKKTINKIETTIPPYSRLQKTLNLQLQFDRGTLAKEIWDQRGPLMATSTLKLYGPDGSELPRGGWGSSWGPNQRGYNRSFVPPDAPGPVKAIFELPTEARKIVVPFEFTDLPLP